MNSTTSIPFKGFYAEMTSGFVRVINENKAAKFKDGSIGHALKVQPVQLISVGGWSGGHQQKPVKAGESFWTRASRIIRSDVKFTG